MTYEDKLARLKRGISVGDSSGTHRMSTEELCHTWNEATSPYVPRTDQEHDECKAIAALCLRELKARPGAWRELSNGMVLPAR